MSSAGAWWAVGLGFALLVVGAELLVRGASRLAAALGVRPLVIGLTIVAFGTSAPELATSVGAALHGSSDLALGNVVGSNIFNVLAILGLSAWIVPLVVHRQLIRLDVPIMIAVSGILCWMAGDGRVGRLEGAMLMLGLGAYTWLQARLGGAGAAPEVDSNAPPASRSALFATNGILIFAGLALLVVGSNRLVVGAAALARAWGVGELVIGLTIVAAGTSLPEAFTSIVAAVRGERDIAVGNVVGSNLFNILGVLGASALISPDGVAVAAEARGFDLPVMLASAVACLPIFFTGHKISRWEGGLFTAYYVAYVSYLAMSASRPSWIPGLRVALFGWAMPLTAVTLGVFAYREWRSRRRGPAV